MQSDFRTTLDNDHFDSDFDDSVSSTDDPEDNVHTDVDQQTLRAVIDTEKLPDLQVLEAVNKLLKVST